MLCMLSQRRLKPGTLDEFRAAWEPDRDAIPQEMRGDRVYVLRNVMDENEVITFHLTGVTPEDLLRLREPLAEALGKRDQAIAKLVESTGVSGVFEVVDEITI